MGCTVCQPPAVNPKLRPSCNPPGSGPQRVVIIGGGFGGLYAAIRLTSLFWPKGTKPQVRRCVSGKRVIHCQSASLYS
jgi:hypothetical protein